MHWANRVVFQTLPDIPIVHPGDDLPTLIMSALNRAALKLEDGDILTVASKVVSRAQGQFVDLQTVEPSDEAVTLAHRIGKEPALVHLVLQESASVSRTAPGVLIVRHRLGFVSANAGIDRSNAAPQHAKPTSGPWVLLLPHDPDASARALRHALQQKTGKQLGIVITDSFGRPFRVGTVGVALGVAGLPAVWDHRGQADLGGRTLEHTSTALADQIAAAADMLAGQSNEGRPVVLIRGLTWTPTETTSAHTLQRSPDKDLYA